MDEGYSGHPKQPLGPDLKTKNKKRFSFWSPSLTHSHTHFGPCMSGRLAVPRARDAVQTRFQGTLRRLRPLFTINQTLSIIFFWFPQTNWFAVVQTVCWVTPLVSMLNINLLNNLFLAPRLKVASKFRSILETRGWLFTPLLINIPKTTVCLWNLVMEEPLLGSMWLVLLTW